MPYRSERPMSNDRQDDKESRRRQHESGRVVFDDRGNSVWQWDETKGPVVDETGELSNLLVPDLEIEGAADEAAEQFNPYNRDPTIRGRRSPLLKALADPMSSKTPTVEPGEEKEELFELLKQRSRSRRS